MTGLWPRSLAHWIKACGPDGKCCMGDLDTSACEPTVTVLEACGIELSLDAFSSLQVLSKIFNFKYSPALILHESCVNHVNECEVMGVSQLDHCSETNMLACS